jgi:hypothetical protein
MARFLYVIARDRLDLLERLKEEFAQEPDVAVVKDRRQGERRRESHIHVPERRSGDRRRRPDLDRDLPAVGWFLTSTQDAEAAR